MVATKIVGTRLTLEGGELMTQSPFLIQHYFR
jgi:hypothetical protein